MSVCSNAEGAFAFIFSRLFFGHEPIGDTDKRSITNISVRNAEITFSFGNGVNTRTTTQRDYI